MFLKVGIMIALYMSVIDRFLPPWKEFFRFLINLKNYAAIIGNLDRLPFFWLIQNPPKYLRAFCMNNTKKVF